MFDQPVFKILARNDTGAAQGHQGGMVIPRDLEDYMPLLTGSTDVHAPTLDQVIEAELYLDGSYKGTVLTRYQYQTWGGMRRAERRLTGNLGPIRNFAGRDDILLIERDLDDPSHYRLSIETKTSSIYPQVLAMAKGRRWGPLNASLPPFGNRDVGIALSEIESKEMGPPVLVSDQRATSISIIKRKVRDVAFRKRLVAIYGSSCAISHRSVQAPSGSSGLDAAHIIPVEAGGTDDPRNGLLLSKDVHWALDNALLYIDSDRRVAIPGVVKAIPSNEFLRSLTGLALRDPSPIALRASDEALHWHRVAVLERPAVGNY